MIQPRGKKGKKIERKERQGAVGKFSVLELLLQTRAALWGEQRIPAAHSPCAPSGARAGEPHSFNQSQMLSLFLHFTGRAQHKAEHAMCSLSPTLIFLIFCLLPFLRSAGLGTASPREVLQGREKQKGCWCSGWVLCLYSFIHQSRILLPLKTICTRHSQNILPSETLPQRLKAENTLEQRASTPASNCQHPSLGTFCRRQHSLASQLTDTQQQTRYEI